MASQATMVEKGYAQVEPNHLSAQRTGQIYAQLPAHKSIEVLENGQFVKYDYANSCVDFTGKGEWMLVFNEVKIYKDRETDCDFAMKRSDYVNAGAGSYKFSVGLNVYDSVGHAMPEDTKMVPRVFKTNVGDIMTTNCIDNAASTLGAGNVLQVNSTGILEAVDPSGSSYDETKMTWQVAAIRTMPDGQKAAKIIRIA